MEKTFLITAEAGIHARPATNLVGEANRFNSNLLIKLGDREVNLKSIMGVMSLGINNGSIVKITADGDDASDALDAIGNIIYQLKLGKEYC